MSRLRGAAARLIDNSYASYSAEPVACAAMLSDGQWIPGVRIESASFSLVIGAVVNALSTAVALRRYDVVAIALSRPAKDHERTFLQSSFPGPFVEAEKDIFVRSTNRSIPPPTAMLSPFLPDAKPANPRAGVELARETAKHASVGESQFPVGAILDCGSNGLIPGVNVEHPDWARIICAERNALGTAISYGINSFEQMYLACAKDTWATPCGACRQLLVELCPTMPICMDRGTESPECTTPESLLPSHFSGRSLRRQPGR
ncbi:MAG: cytidine deaminase [Bacteroidetes bacterium]|nr:cytidine deaminase [Bacteroidota bacterium]